MKAKKKWLVEIAIDEHDGCTRARARLHDHRKSGFVGVGYSRRNPADTDVPEIGDELAASRALSKLAYELLFAALTDIEKSAHVPVFATA